MRPPEESKTNYNNAALQSLHRSTNPMCQTNQTFSPNHRWFFHLMQHFQKHAEQWMHSCCIGKIRERATTFMKIARADSAIKRLKLNLASDAANLRAGNSQECIFWQKLQESGAGFNKTGAGSSPSAIF